MRTLAPLVIFVYKRAEITKKMLYAINQNFLAKETEVFIFSDGPKGNTDVEQVKQVRKLIKEFECNNNFKRLSIIEEEKNKGLANSIIGGVTKIINKYGKVIVLEDDLVVATNFLQFMNDCLEYYQDMDNVWSIGGTTYNLQGLSQYKHDVYACYRGESCGWASWKNRWDMIDWNVSDYWQFRHSIRRRLKFKRGGQDMVAALERQMSGQTDSWAIRWCYCQSKNDMITILPRKSFVKNIGWGEDSTHAKEDYDIFYTSVESEEFHYHLEPVSIDKVLMREFRKYFSRPLFKRVLDKVYEKWKECKFEKYNK